MFIAHSLALPFLPSERVKLIAFAGSERSRAFPNIPTVAESGVPGYDYASWISFFALKGTHLGHAGRSTCGGDARRFGALGKDREIRTPGGQMMAGSSFGSDEEACSLS